jgi:lysylphosphatidylglycerol synthetase-like protein (DUF2156 family)
MAAIERHTIPVPYGHHVFVLSDLSLSPRTKTRCRPLVEVTELLGDLDDPAVVVVAGNLFFPVAGDVGSGFVRATLDHVPGFAAAIQEFTAHPTHQFFVLPGVDDAALLDDESERARLEELGVVVASDVMLQVAGADGVRDLAVTAGSHRVDVANVDGPDRADADRLEDPAALASFVASRVLYRRLAPWVWLVLVALIVADLFNSITKLITHFTHHVYKVHAPHTNSFWGNLIVNLFVLIIAEAIVVAAAGLVVRRRFNRSHHGDAESEPLANTLVDQVDALEYARRIVERGGVGAVVGGAPRPALAYLDQGVCAVPGPSRTVLVKREGRFGLPPVFASVTRLGIVEIEAAGTVQVRLVGGESSLSRSRLLERLVAGTTTQVGPPDGTSTLGSWPHGSPFPVTQDRLQIQRRQRMVRRWASGLLAADGLINVAVTASPPLRSRLHTVLTFLPLGVAQSAAVVTAVAGIAMIMLARGVRRGQRRAWFLALSALILTVVAHLARGGSLLASVIAAGLAFYLIVQRRNFLAAADRNTARSILPRLVVIAVIAVVAAALGIEAASRHRYVLPNFGVVLMGCLERLIGQYNIFLPDRSTDFVDPVLLTVGVSLVVTALYVVTRPVVDRRLSTTSTSAERRVAELRARDIVRRHGRGTLDYFALRDDKQFFFFRDSLVAYAVYGGVALISPDPVGPDAERTEVFNAFRTYSEARGWTIAVMGAGADWLGTYHAAGMHYLYLGDEAIVDCQTFSLEGGKMKGLRQACTRLKKHGYTVQFLDPADIDPAQVTGVLDLISMLRRGEHERGFSMMLGRLFDPKDKGLLLTLVYGPDGRAAAACQFVPSPAINGYSLDLMRRDPGDHPNGLIDYALCSTIAHLKEQGAQGLSLNFAAFRSVFDGERGEGTFTRVERWTLKRLSGILPIESLWLFNAKFHPRWLPRYIVYPAAESFVPVVGAILRAESITEIPVLGRFLTNDPRNRPGTVVPPDVLAAAQRFDEQVEESV